MLMVRVWKQNIKVKRPYTVAIYSDFIDSWIVEEMSDKPSRADYNYLYTIKILPFAHNDIEKGEEILYCRLPPNIREVIGFRIS